MKKQITTAIARYSILATVLLTSLYFAVLVIPLAIGQRNATKQSAAKSKATASGAAAVATKLSGVVRTPVTTGPAFSINRPPPPPAAPNVVLYDQYNNVGANATLSATFTDFPTFSSDLADDFCVPASCTWTVNSIDADGVYFNGAGPATSWNVYIYNNANCLPTSLVCSTVGTTVTQVGTTFTVNFTPACVLTGAAGTGTQYWVEIQANMTFNPQGEWGWTDRTVQNLCPAVWQNTGGGFGVCPTWMPKLAVCVPSAAGPDQVFRLNGTATGACTGGCAQPTPTPTPTPCANCGTYNTTTTTGATIVPGTTDIGNHCDDCPTLITLPFPICIYGTTYTSANVSSNGSLDLVGNQAPFTHGCQVLPSTLWTTAILPYQDDLRTDQFSGCSVFPGGQCGVFTSTVGTKFYIEWRVVKFNDTTLTANFELVFDSTNPTCFDVVYGATHDSGLDETSGVQASSSGPATTFSCGTATLTSGLDVRYCCPGAFMTDHFKVYEIVQPQSPRNLPVSLRDQFGEVYMPYTVYEPVLFANPVDKHRRDTGEDTDRMNPDLHLKFYHLHQPPQTSPTPVMVTNQLYPAPQDLQVYEAWYLAVPSLKSELGSPTPAPTVRPGLDHFKCYRCTGDPRGVAVDLYDQFHERPTGEMNVIVVRPAYLCNPVDKVYNGNPTLRQHPMDHLVLYTINQQPDFFREVNTYNQFGYELELPLNEAMYLAVPSTKTTPTPPPDCNAWQTAAAYPVTDVRYGFAQTPRRLSPATPPYFYVFGGVSNGTRINGVRRYNLDTGVWEGPLAPMPFTSEAPTCALMQGVPVTPGNPVGDCVFIYCAEGDTGTGFAVYDADANTWAALPNTPSTAGNDYGSASGAWNGRFYLVGGTTNFLPDVWVFNTGTNTWAAGNPAQDGFLLAGYTQVGKYLYLAGGWTGGVATGLTTTRRLDLASGVWDNTGPAFMAGRADFGLAFDPGKCKLYALGGDTQGGGFFDSTNVVNELPISLNAPPNGWPCPWVLSPPNLPTPNRQANSAGFHGALCATGTLSGGTIWSTGGIDGASFTFLADHIHRANMCSPTAVSAVSRINHGSCGTFDVDLPLWCPAGIECRQGSPANTYTMVVTFDEPIAAPLPTVTVCGTGTAAAPTGVGTCALTIVLSGVTNAQTINVALNNVKGANTGNTTPVVNIPMGILVGDVNGNGSVNAADVAVDKSQNGIAVTACNFRADVNHNCAINAGDNALVKSLSGTALPNPTCCPTFSCAAGVQK